MADILMGKAQGLPYDIQTEQARLARQRMLVDALYKQSLSQSSPTIDAGVYKVANWSEPISKALQALAAMKSGQDLDSQEATVAKEYNHRLQTGVQDFMKGMQGYQGTTGQGMATSLDQQDMPIDPSVAQNPMKAIAQAMGSGVPDLKGMAAPYFTAMTKGQIGDVDVLKEGHYYDPVALARYMKTRDPADLIGRGKVEKYGDVAVPTKDATVGQPQAVNTYTPPAVDMTSGAQTQTNTLTNKTETATGFTTPPAKSGVTTLYDAALGDYGKELSGGKQKAIEAMQKLPTLQTAMQLTDQLNSGVLWSSIEQSAKKVALGLGVSPDKLGSVTSSEQFNALMSQTALDTLKALRPASDADLQYATRLAGTSPLTDPRTAKVLVSLAASGAANTLMQHAKNVGRARTFEGQPGAQGLSKQIEDLYGVPFDFNDKTLGGLGIKSGPGDIYSSQIMGAMPGQPGAPGGAQPTQGKKYVLTPDGKLIQQ